MHQMTQGPGFGGGGPFSHPTVILLFSEGGDWTLQPFSVPPYPTSPVLLASLWSFYYFPVILFLFLLSLVLKPHPALCSEITLGGA